jgi:hypothetical protein
MVSSVLNTLHQFRLPNRQLVVALQKKRPFGPVWSAFPASNVLIGVLQEDIVKDIK